MFAHVVSELTEFVAMHGEAGCSACDALDCVCDYILPQVSTTANDILCGAIFEAMLSSGDVAALREGQPIRDYPFGEESSVWHKASRINVVLKASLDKCLKTIGVRPHATPAERTMALFFCNHLVYGVCKAKLHDHFPSLRSYHETLHVLLAAKVLDTVNVLNSSAGMFEEVLFLSLVSPRNKYVGFTSPGLLRWIEGRRGERTLVVFENLEPFVKNLIETAARDKRQRHQVARSTRGETGKKGDEERMRAASRPTMPKSKLDEALAEHLHIAPSRTLKRQFTRVLPLIGFHVVKLLKKKSLREKQKKKSTTVKLFVESRGNWNYSSDDDDDEDRLGNGERKLFSFDPRLPLALQIILRGRTEEVDLASTKPLVAIDDKHFAGHVKSLAKQVGGVDIGMKRIAGGKTFTICVRPLNAIESSTSGENANDDEVEGKPSTGRSSAWCQEQILRAVELSPNGVIAMLSLAQLVDRKAAIRAVAALRSAGKLVTTSIRIPGKELYGIVALASAVLSDEIKQFAVDHYLEARKRRREEIPAKIDAGHDKSKMNLHSGADADASSQMSNDDENQSVSSEYEGGKKAKRRRVESSVDFRLTKVLGKMFAACNGYCTDDRRRLWRLHLELWNVAFRGNSRYIAIETLLSEMTTGTFCVTIGLMDALPRGFVTGELSWAAPVRMLRYSGIHINSEHFTNQLRYLLRLLYLHGLIGLDDAGVPRMIEVNRRVIEVNGDVSVFDAGNDGPSAVMVAVCRYWLNNGTSPPQGAARVHNIETFAREIDFPLSLSQMAVIARIHLTPVERLCEFAYILRGKTILDRKDSVMAQIRKSKKVAARRDDGQKTKKTRWNKELTKSAVLAAIRRILMSSASEHHQGVSTIAGGRRLADCAEMLRRLETILRRSSSLEDDAVSRERLQFIRITKDLRSVLLTLPSLSTNSVEEMLRQFVSPNMAGRGASSMFKQEQSSAVVAAVTVSAPQQHDPRCDLCELLRCIAFTDRTRQDDISTLERLHRYSEKDVATCFAHLRSFRQFTAADRKRLNASIRPTRIMALPSAYGLDELTTCTVVPHAHTLAGHCLNNVSEADTIVVVTDQLRSADVSMLIRKNQLDEIVLPLVSVERQNHGDGSSSNSGNKTYLLSSNANARPTTEEDSLVPHPSRYAVLHGHRFRHNTFLSSIPLDTADSTCPNVDPAHVPQATMLRHEDGTFNNFIFRVISAGVYDTILSKPGVLHRDLEEDVCGKHAVSPMALETVVAFLIDSLAVDRSWVTLAPTANPFAHPACAGEGVGDYSYTATFQSGRPAIVTSL